jgi:hypothetical protein
MKLCFVTKWNKKNLICNEVDKKNYSEEWMNKQDFAEKKKWKDYADFAEKKMKKIMQILPKNE